MRLAVLGASGQTGKEVVKQALDTGHSVTAVVRDPSKITTTHDNLKVVKGNIFDYSSLKDIFKGHDAVVSCLGFSRNSQPVTGYSKSFEAVAHAMREANVNRFVVMTSWFTERHSDANESFLIRWFVEPFIRPCLIDMYKMEQYMESSCSDLDYTVVRPPGLVNGAKTDCQVKVVEGYTMKTGHAITIMNRADVASFMLKCAVSQDYTKKMIAIAKEEKKK